MYNMENTGFGRISPQDTEEFIEVTVTFRDGEVTEAVFSCSDDPYLTDCGETVCRMIKYHTADCFTAVPEIRVIGAGKFRITDLTILKNNRNLNKFLRILRSYSSEACVFHIKR